MSQQPEENRGGLRIAVDPDSTICQRVQEIVENAEGKISGQDHGFVVSHLEDCPKCRQSLKDKLGRLKLDIP